MTTDTRVPHVHPVGERWDGKVDPAFLRKLRGFVATEISPNADAIDREDVYPTAIIRALAREGYSAIFMPERLGGGGLDYKHALAVFEEVSYGSAAVGISLITILQAQTILQQFGCASLQERYLPQLANGMIASYALTEANHGSDIRTLDTKAVRHGDQWHLSGEKSFITSGSAAEFYIILAQTDKGVSAFAVPADAPGVSSYVGVNSATFGLRNGPHVNLVLNDVALPGDHLIGEEGRGVRAAVTTLDYSRTMAAGISIGIGRAAFDHALAHTKSRMIFDGSVFDKQGIQWYFADMLTSLDAASLLAHRAANALDSGLDITRYPSEAKLFAARVATDVASTCIQVCGAYGVMENAPYGRFLRDAKAYEIAGGSAETLKNTIGKAIKGFPEAP